MAHNLMNIGHAIPAPKIRTVCVVCGQPWLPHRDAAAARMGAAPGDKLAYTTADCAAVSRTDWFIEPPTRQGKR